MQTSIAPRDRTWITRPVESGAAAGFGVYLHVPFCDHRCGYCDFATAAVGDRSRQDRDALFDRYVAALLTDLGRQVAVGRRGHPGAPTQDRPLDGWPTVTSIFVGGGTPTLLGAERLGRVVRAVAMDLDVARDVEVTVECNPETASAELFAGLAAVGVTRVSMGAQSFSSAVLETLERGHTVDRPLEAVQEARAGGIGQVSLDLIFGTPGETAADWQRTLEQAVAAGTDHLSAYALTIHDNTAFGRAVATGRMPAPDDDVQRERFDVARQVLGAAGFDHYEISNWARRPIGADRPGVPTRSRHNLLYWRHGDYLGIGVGAHAHLDGRRWWSTRSTQRYIEAIEDGATAVVDSEELDDMQRAEERLLLGLRVREGIHPNDLPPIDALALEEAIGAGLVETTCGRVRCTDHGWFLLDEAVQRLI